MTSVQQRVSSPSQPVQRHADTGDQTGASLRTTARGHDFATGEAMFAPVQRKASGAPGAVVQRDESANKIESTRLETESGGHSLDRHGPEVSDQALQDRLTTGMAPDGKLSPAPGLSTKFATYDEYLKTRTAATSLMSNGLTKAVTTLQSSMDGLKNAKAAFDNEPSGPGKGQKSKDLATKKTELKSAVTGIGQASADTAPVKYVQSGRNPEDMVVLYGSYGAVVDHGRVIGSGFEGEDEKQVTNPVDSSKDDITVYDKTNAISGGVSQTQTTFEAATAGKNLFGVTHNPSSWKVVQHFPTKDQTNGLSI